MTKTMAAWLGGSVIAAAAAGCGGEPSTELALPDSTTAPEAAVVKIPAQVALGQQIFFDTNLSSPAGQSCASCHDRSRSFTDPDSGFATSEGVNPGRFGSRNTPTARYAKYSPPFHYDADGATYVGGQFWDGRATSLEAQAKGPFVNPIEMNNPSHAAVVQKIQASSYAQMFIKVYGPNAFADVETAYDNMARAIAAYERTNFFSPFTSKYDAYLAGTATLTPQEQHGLALFEDPAKGNCSACHPSQPSADGTPPLFTDFTYDNLGLPKNPNNPFYSDDPQYNPAGASFVDLGLGGVLGEPSENGKFKVPTLRNLAKTGPYTHAGYFTDLRSVVDFYNSRDVKPWPAPEVPDTVNHDELGNLGMTDAEIDDLTAFLGTLTDGYSQ